jgi:hypothetical protein
MPCNVARFLLFNTVMQSLFRPFSPAVPVECTGGAHVIPVEDALIGATLNVPPEARAVIVMPCASSANRFVPDQRFVGDVFDQTGMATLKVDLLTPEEEAALPIDKHRHQDIALLTRRLLGTVAWLKEQPATAHLRVGVFAGTHETVPALIAAERSADVAAVVSRGGCPDSFDDTLTRLKASTLLIVGRDEQSRAAELASEFFARTLLR